MKQQLDAAVKEVGKGEGTVSEHGFILVSGIGNGAGLTVLIPGLTWEKEDEIFWY